MQKTGVRVFKLFCVDCESAVILLLCLTLMQIHNYILLKLQILFVELVDFLLRLNGQLTKGRLNQFSLLTVLYYFPPFTTRPCADPEGGRGGSRPPEKSQKYRVSKQFWSGPPGKSQNYDASIQCWAIIDPPAKRHLNGVSLAGR